MDPLRLFHRPPRPPAEVAPTYAFAEPRGAVAYGKEHLRPLAPGEPLALGGISFDATALCGRDLRGGWDLPTPATTATIRSLSTPRAGDGRVWLCAACTTAEKARRKTAESPQHPRSPR